MPLKTPVAFIIFNRPDLTKIVFEAIRKAEPKKLLVIADGPRLDRVGEAELCETARAVIETVDWDCEVVKRYSSVNLGCGINVSQGISWVFEQVEEAIILEDDCHPHEAFFPFCEDLLIRYQDDERVSMISGTNFFGQWKPAIQSYHFSHFAGIWGWASWRRAWALYDYEMQLFPKASELSFLNNILIKQRYCDYWQDLFQKSYNDAFKLNTWDYQWLFARWIHNTLGIIPSVNLVSNLGFRSDATHTRSSEAVLSNMPWKDIKFPLTHPDFMVRDLNLDQLVQESFFKTGKKSKFRNFFTDIRKANV